MGDNSNLVIKDRAVDQLKLRGPDSTKSLRSGDTSIVFTRLAIIDMTSDVQPIEYDAGKYLVCNGEIYNYQELQENLLEQTTKIKLSSDIAVMAEVIKAQGLDVFLKEAIGMFSFTIVDVRKKRICAVRDYVGEKPIYYALSKNNIIVASSLKAVAIQLGEVTLDSYELNHWLNFGVNTQGRTIYREIHEIPAGSRLDWDGNRVTLNRYWNWPETKPTHPNFYVEFENQLNRGVKLISQADSEVSIAVSNGLDSRLLIDLFTKGFKSNNSLQLINVTMDEQTFSEEFELPLTASSDTCEHSLWKIELESKVIASEIPAFLEKLDTPCMDPAIIVTNLIARTVSGKRRVIVTGDGGDELFQGYEIYRLVPILILLLPLMKILLRGSLLDFLIMKLSAKRDESYMTIYQKILRLLTSLKFEKRNFFVNAVSPNFLWSYLSKKNIIKSNYSIKESTDFNKFMRDTYLPQLLLHKADGGSMIEGVEFRSFFLMRNLIELASEAPRKIKRRNLYFNLTGDAYFLMRRKKHGLGVPMTKIMKHTKEPDSIVNYAGIDETLIKNVYQHRDWNPGFANAQWALLTLGYHLRAIVNLGVAIKSTDIHPSEAIN